MTVYWRLGRLTPLDAPWTRGVLAFGQVGVHTAELPWKDNEHDVSCIAPNDTDGYRLVPHPTRADKIRVEDVPGRSLINIEVFNDPETESKGCIAPGLTYDDDGVQHSRDAMNSVIHRARAIWDRGDELRLRVCWRWQSTARATGRKDKIMSFIKTLEEHTTFAKTILDPMVPSADRAEVNAAADVVGRAFKAIGDIRTGDFADLAKQVETAGPEIDQLVQGASADARKLWDAVRTRLHHHGHAKTS